MSKLRFQCTRATRRLNGKPWLPISVTTLLLPMLIAGLAWAADTVAWSPVRNLSNLPGRSFQATQARVPSTGDIYVTWTEDGLEAEEEIIGRRWVQSTQIWLPLENLSASQAWERDGGAVLAFDQQGQGLLIWTRTYAATQGAPADGYDILWRAWNGTSWENEQVLLHGDSYLPGSPGTFGLIPVETSDGLVLFITWGTSYRTAAYQDGSWSQVAPWIHLDVSLVQVISDDGGILYAAAYGPNSSQNGTNRYFNDAYYLTFDGENWSAPLNLSYTDGVSTDVGLAFDSQGLLHFLWSDPDSPYSDESLKSAIWERINKEGEWAANVVLVGGEPDQAISGFSLAEDVNTNLHLAWSEGIIVDGAHTDLNMYYKSSDGTTWESSETVFTSSAASRYPVLAPGIDDVSLIWQEVFWAGGSLQDHEVFFSRRNNNHRTYLPLVSK